MDNAFEARTIVRSCRSGALATQDRDSKQPYVSLSAYSCDVNATPVFLLSDLADHTQNIAKNPHVSLLCEQASHLSNPQAGPRVTLVGKMVKVEDRNERTIFTQIHPSAKMYADFGDFNFYRLNVEKAHFVGGFGRAVWLEQASFFCDSAASLLFAQEQESLIRQLNADLPDLARVCATKLLKLRGKNWNLLRIDPDGIDLKLASKISRYPFEKQLKNGDEVMRWATELLR